MQVSFNSATIPSLTGQVGQDMKMQVCPALPSLWFKSSCCLKQSFQTLQSNFCFLFSFQFDFRTASGEISPSFWLNSYCLLTWLQILTSHLANQITLRDFFKKQWINKNKGSSIEWWDGRFFFYCIINEVSWFSEDLCVATWHSRSCLQFWEQRRFMWMEY